MRWQLALALCAAACGGEDKDKTGGGSDSKGCAATRFAVELSDEKAALMKALFDHVDRDKDAPKIGVYAQIDQWKDAAGTPHTDYRLAGSDRAIIAKYLEARAKADPKLAPAAERAFRYEKTFASGRTYWRTHYVIVPAILDGTAVKAAEAGTDGRVTVQLTPEAVAKLAGTTAANPARSSPSAPATR